MTDSLDTLVQIVTDQKGGFLFANGKSIDDLDQTVEKLGLLDGQQIFVTMTLTCGQPLKWHRFKEDSYRRDPDYCSLERTYADAVVFKPKRDIIFMGYGIFGSYHKRDIMVKVGWEIEGEKSEFYEISLVHEEISEEGTHDFKLVDIGEKPIKVSADT